MTEMYRLPDGKYTRSQKRYLRGWKALTKPLEALFAAQCYGFDPSIGMQPKNGMQSFALPAWAARVIVNALSSNAEVSGAGTPSA